MDKLRQEIDLIDRQMLELLSKRLEISKAIAEYKRENALPIYDAKRERMKIASIRELVKAEYADSAEALFECIFEISRSCQNRMLKAGKNIVLIGMPGCGKNTIARKLCDISGKQLADSDEVIQKNAGMSIAEIFAESGEQCFRRLETEALTELSKCAGLVIATGGGCVTIRENYPLLMKNSVIVWLKRDIDKLERKGRPLSLGADLNEMFARRAPLYRMLADITVENDSDPALVAERIWRRINEASGDKRSVT